jgi:hypothetical protein
MTPELVVDAAARSWFERPMLVFGAAAAIVILRTLVYLVFEQVAFDSDQAVVGLMAKHLMEGRAFPLFYYGQTYMLAVEAWVAVPFFSVAGPTVFALRLSILAWNIAFGAMLLVGLRRELRLSPWLALLPALFFLSAPPSVSAQLVDAQGGIIEPFVYIGCLWFLRRHPVWFGAVLGLGFRHREFTLYAVPVLLVLEVLTRQMSRTRVREWLISVAVFCAVWESIEALKPFADLMGPGTRGQLLGGFSGSQFSNLAGRFDWQAGALGERIGAMAVQLLGWLLGARQIDTNLTIPDRRWLVWAAGLCILLACGRLLYLVLRPETARVSDTASSHPWRDRIARAQFAFYLLGVGTLAVAVFLAGKPVLQGYSRYALLGLLIPVGLVASLLRLESRRLVRQLITIVVLAWGALMLADHTSVLVAYLRNPPRDEVRELSDYLVAQQIPAAISEYWRAYLISFIAREAVTVASNGIVRIQEYQQRFSDRSSDAVVISDRTCPGGRQVARWYLCKP